MESGTPPTWRPAFAGPRPENPLRVLAVPAFLTIVLGFLTLIAWAAGALDVFWTGVFWEAFLWGGVLLYFAGLAFDRRLRGVRA
jgi:hypothetical protein